MLIQLPLHSTASDIQMITYEAINAAITQELLAELQTQRNLNSRLEAHISQIARARSTRTLANSILQSHGFTTPLSTKEAWELSLNTRVLEKIRESIQPPEDQDASEAYSWWHNSIVGIKKNKLKFVAALTFSIVAGGVFKSRSLAALGIGYAFSRISLINSCIEDIKELTNVPEVL